MSTKLQNIESSYATELGRIFLQNLVKAYISIIVLFLNHLIYMYLHAKASKVTLVIFPEMTNLDSLRDVGSLRDIENANHEAPVISLYIVL